MRARVARFEAAASAPDDDRWLSAKEAAAVLGVSTRTLYQFCRTGDLRHARITMNGNGVMRFRRSWLDAFMEARTTRGRLSARVTSREPSSH